MGKYTIYNNESVDREIDRKLELVVDSIVKHLNTNVQSILLTGGYGRGEGSVIINNGEVVLLKDFDVAVIVNKIPDAGIHKLMLEELYTKIGSDNPEKSLFRHSTFALDLRYLTIDNINYPDIWFYDLKNAMVLYGRDIRSYITYGNSDIPLSSGLRLLFEKVTGLLGHSEYRMLFNVEYNMECTKYIKLLVYECMKTYVEIATALCILHKVYIPSYRRRVEIIKTLYSKNILNEIVKYIPDLVEKIENATNFKLKPDFSIVKDPLELFFATRNDLAMTIKYYLKYYIEFEIDDWLDVDMASKLLAKVYYKPMLIAWLRNRFKFNIISRPLIDILNSLYQIYTNIKYIQIVHKDLSEIRLKSLFYNYTISPSLKFFPAGLLILLSLNRDGSVNNNLLSKGIKILRNLIPIDKIITWDDARQVYLKSYKYYLYPTLLK